jgi:hypothetical protein
MSVDPALAQTDQPYAYAGDDPVNEGDPSGLDTDETSEVPPGVVETFSAMNYDRRGYHDVYLTQGAINHMELHIDDFTDTIAQFVGKPVIDVTGQAFETFLDAISKTLKTPQSGDDGIELTFTKGADGGTNISLLYQAPYNIYDEETFAVKRTQFFVSVGYSSNLIYTAYDNPDKLRGGKLSNVADVELQPYC